MEPWHLVWLVASAHVWVRGTIVLSVRNWRECDDETAKAWARATPVFEEAIDWVERWWKTRATRKQRLARLWRQFANCPLCSGFWIGVGGYGLLQVFPTAIRLLGIGALVGTLALAACGFIRRL